MKFAALYDLLQVTVRSERECKVNKNVIKHEQGRGVGLAAGDFFGVVAVECLCFLLNIIDGDLKRGRGSQGQRGLIGSTVFARKPLPRIPPAVLKG